MRFLIAWIFRLPLVYTEDYDCDVRLRFARKSPFNKWIGKGIISRCIFHQDGRVTGASYVRYWKPANAIAKELIPYNVGGPSDE